MSTDCTTAVAPRGGDRFESLAPPSGADWMIAGGDADVALDLMVRTFAAWARDQ